MNTFDVIVVGGGPAGSTVASFLALGGKRVLLLEKSRFPREKLCGEFISPECTAIFERLGVTDAINAAGAKTIRWMDLVAPNGRRIQIPVNWFASAAGAATGLSRARLDTILLSRARDVGVDVREGFSVSGVERFATHSEVIGRLDGDERTRFSGTLIVDASGRGQSIAQRGNAAPEEPAANRNRLFACKIHLRGQAGLDGFGELYFFRDGYGGLSEVEPDELGPRVNLCFLTTESVLNAAKGDRQRLLDLTILTNPAAAARLGEIIPAGEDGWIGAGPLRYGQRARVPGLIAVGDARAFIDPFTGSGILLALSSAELAAKAICTVGSLTAVQSEEVEERYRELYRGTIGFRLKAADLLRRLALTPASRRVLVPLLARSERITRLLALSTRQRGGGEGNDPQTI